MWRLEKAFKFEAAHSLPYHRGKCKRVHGHSWHGKVVLERNDLTEDGPEAGMVTDFGKVKEVIDQVLDQYLDHLFLNESTGMRNPTSELLAKWLYDHLKVRLPYLAAIVIQETDSSTCEYRP